MSSDKQNEVQPHDTHAGDHEGIDQWVSDMMVILKEEGERRGLCPFCATSSLANLLMANSLARVLHDPEQTTQYLMLMAEDTARTARKIRSAEDAI